MTTKACRAMKRATGTKGKGIHTAKFHRAVTKIKKSGTADNPYAVAMATLGKEKAVKKSHRRRKKS